MPTQLSRKQDLLDCLDRKRPGNTDKQLPDELVVMVLQHLLSEDQQPVRVKVITQYDEPWELVALDPCRQTGCPIFEGCQMSERLQAIAHETYFMANTIRIDAPTERSPKQILRSHSFLTPWARDVRSLELVLTFEAVMRGSINDLNICYGSRSKTTYTLEQRDVDRVAVLLMSLKQAFPQLRRLTLMLTIHQPWNEDMGRCCGRGRRRVSINGQLCCVLEGKEPSFEAAFVKDIAPALRALDLNYVAFKWRTSCGHSPCKKLLADCVKAEDDATNLIEDGEHSIAVLKDRKMARWARG